MHRVRCDKRVVRTAHARGCHCNLGAGIQFDNRLLATRVANNTTTQYRVVEVLEGWWYYMRGGGNFRWKD